MDGSEARILVKNDLLSPISLIYHSKTRKIYWSDIGRKKIESLSLDDLTSRTQVISDGVEQPTGLAIWDTTSQSNDDSSSLSILYYADQVQECIVAFNLRTYEKNIIKSNVPYIEQLKLYQRPQLQSYGDEGASGNPNPCLINNGGCHQICLPSKRAAQGRECRCSNGLELQMQDSVSCRPYKSFVFFGTDMTMRAIPFGGGGGDTSGYLQNYIEALPKITGVNMRKFDFDYRRGQIYWIEDGSLIKSLTINASWSSRAGYKTLIFLKLEWIDRLHEIDSYASNLNFCFGKVRFSKT